ncbi:hypothetical protein C8F04DRAFT_1276698 [Mycena alexandri]|uniref:Uncharacterized protein n=1 Tax=Mycena alexandri TaxID=1745969 RepID=A0AAD6WNA3_9AGAR|nr:hypothetical protein C8F04DRAFT_1276698 [Mycena alexandri]
MTSDADILAQIERTIQRLLFERERQRRELTVKAVGSKQLACTRGALTRQDRHIKRALCTIPSPYHNAVHNPSCEASLQNGEPYDYSNFTFCSNLTFYSLSSELPPPWNDGTADEGYSTDDFDHGAPPDSSSEDEGYATDRSDRQPVKTSTTTVDFLKTTFSTTAFTATLAKESSASGPSHFVLAMEKPPKRKKRVAVFTSKCPIARRTAPSAACAPQATPCPNPAPGSRSRSHLARDCRVLAEIARHWEAGTLPTGDDCDIDDSVREEQEEYERRREAKLPTLRHVILDGMRPWEKKEFLRVELQQEQQGEERQARRDLGDSFANFDVVQYVE